PAPIQLAIPIPTFLGERFYVQDLRAKLNLQEGLDAVAAYRAGHGSPEGFDAAIGEQAVPALAWTDGVPAESLRVGVVTGPTPGVQLVSLSDSGRAFCVRPDLEGLGAVTYGTGGEVEGNGTPKAAVAQAMTSCGS